MIIFFSTEAGKQVQEQYCHERMVQKSQREKNNLGEYGEVGGRDNVVLRKQNWTKSKEM